MHGEVVLTVAESERAELLLERLDHSAPMRAQAAAELVFLRALLDACRNDRRRLTTAVRRHVERVPAYSRTVVFLTVSTAPALELVP